MSIHETGRYLLREQANVRVNGLAGKSSEERKQRDPAMLPRELYFVSVTRLGILPFCRRPVLSRENDAWLADWLAGRSADWLAGWLSDWFVGVQAGVRVGGWSVVRASGRRLEVLKQLGVFMTLGRHELKLEGSL